MASDIERDELAASMRALAKRAQVLARIGPDRGDAGGRFRQAMGDVLRLLSAAPDLIYRSSVRLPQLVDPGGPGAAEGQSSYSSGTPSSYSSSVGSPPVAPPSSACDLQGTTRAFPISQLVDLLGSTKKSGLLRIKGASETFNVLFQDGAVVHASSDKAPPGQRLGDILVQSGYIDEKRLEQFLTRHHRTGGKIGVALEREELVTREQLAEALSRQVQCLFHRLFETRDATFSFQERPTDSYDHRVKMSATHLLLESARVHDESLR